MSKTVLVTGNAGFIGFHTTNALVKQGYRVVGIDQVNDYYDITLKHDRLTLLEEHGAGRYVFYKGDLEDKRFIDQVFEKENINIVVNLAAQAGVRYSLKNPYAYIESNIVGFVNILEACRHHKVEQLIYASSSSVYGINRKLPFAEDDTVDHPISLYAATKKSNELMAHTYSHLFGIPTTGLRFFTVYGPWGRPDMAMFLFANAILSDKPLTLFNEGNLRRDFTYVEDVVESIGRLCKSPSTPDAGWDPVDPTPCTSSAPYRIYNIGNHSPVIVRDLVSTMERILGKKAKIDYAPMQPGDVEATFANVDRLYDAVQFQPKTTLEDGVKKFLTWFVEYREKRLKAGDQTFGRISK